MSGGTGPENTAADSVAVESGETNLHTQQGQATFDAKQASAMEVHSRNDEMDKQKKLSAAEQARLASLKSMLDASNARYQQASKNRAPIFAAGLEVKVIKGEYTGQVGVVLDADYITNRALLSLPGQAAPCWIGFRSLGHSE